jgi:chemotaxis protein MotB
VSRGLLPSVAPRSTRASGDRWLFGYADVVTLLFACFAALYAAATAPVPVASAAAPAPPSQSIRVDLAAEFAQLRLRESELQIDVTRSPRGTVVSLAEAGSFAPGDAELSPAAIRAIGDLAALLQSQPHQIRVEGHTDDRPIRNQRFASNWELSTARATRVVQWLVEDGRIAPARLSAAGYAEYRPRVANTEPEGRARNRRVDIVVLDAQAQDAPDAADYRTGGSPPSGGR